MSNRLSTNLLTGSNSGGHTLRRPQARRLLPMRASPRKPKGDIGPRDVDRGGLEVDLLDPDVDELADPQCMGGGQ
jgi:hypothetical protein